MSSRSDFADYLDNFRRRVLQDALAEATAAYWIRRAEAFESAAIERPGDSVGRSTEAERDERARRLVEAAVACRNRAAICDIHEWSDAVGNIDLEQVA